MQHRTFLAGSILWLFLAALSLAGDTRAEGPWATGVVFLDEDRDGLRGEAEPGLVGVLVSNGVDVVATDEAGRYRIPMAAARALFVIEPRGKRAPLSPQNLPRFFHPFEPADGPPTSDLEVDFPLIPRAEPDEFEVLLIADPQPYHLGEVDHYARRVIAERIGEPQAFALILGDLVGDDLDLFEPLNQVHAQLGFPIYNVVGNHDLDFTSTDDLGSKRTYRRVYGPTDYAFQYGPRTF